MVLGEILFFLGEIFFFKMSSCLHDNLLDINLFLHEVNKAGM